MSITVTEKAAGRIRHYVDRQPGSVGLRVGIRRTGCSGYSYTVDVAETVRDTDQVFTDHGVTVVVDQQHLPVIAGCTIDYVREGLNEKFAFTNPNAGDACGCGESFSLPTANH
jgi:iron-sulfur cluster assembly protein